MSFRAELIEQSEELARCFRSARPRPHVVIDDFLDEPLLKACLAEFKDEFEATRHTYEIDPRRPGESICERMRSLGPGFRALDRLFSSRRFLDFIGSVTGIPDLIHDPEYVAAGPRNQCQGYFAAAHVDFSRHMKNGLYRRVSIMLYLNELWRPRWGGRLVLHSSPRLPDGPNEAKAIVPLLNRLVLFGTTEDSWHEVDKVELPRRFSRLQRRSVAVHAYTKAPPPEPEAARRDLVIWVHRPLPLRLRPGRRLTSADVKELRHLLETRDTHLARLYEFEQMSRSNQRRFDAILDQLKGQGDFSPRSRRAA